MLGWEFPPRINGGLGVACEGLSQALAPLTPVTLLLPQTSASPSPQAAPALSPDLSLPEGLTPYLELSADPSHDLYGPDLPVKILEFARETAEAAQSLSFDLIHAHDWMTAVAGLEIRARTGKPLVFHVHSLSYDREGPKDQKDQGWVHDLEQSVLRQADLVLAVSDYTRTICLERYRAHPDRTVVLHNGAALVRAFRSPKPFPEKLVIFLGRLASQKGPARFLEIARRVVRENPQVRFAVAGAGDQLHRLMAMALRLGLRDHLHFTGFLKRKEVHHLLSMADAYCMPSTSEPFGLSALEATQFGLPIVLSAESGVAEILPEARTAPAKDTGGLARHLLETLSQDVPKTFPPVRKWEEAARELLEHYHKVLNPQRPTAKK